jgi:hypothetical protein
VVWPGLNCRRSGSPGHAGLRVGPKWLQFFCSLSCGSYPSEISQGDHKCKMLRSIGPAARWLRRQCFMSVEISVTVRPKNQRHRRQAPICEGVGSTPTAVTSSPDRRAWVSCVKTWAAGPVAAEPLPCIKCCQGQRRGGSLAAATLQAPPLAFLEAHTCFEQLGA